jgi:hypothetical protein
MPSNIGSLIPEADCRLEVETKAISGNRFKGRARFFGVIEGGKESMFISVEYTCGTAQEALETSLFDVILQMKRVP